jgi:SlyX protein
MDDRIVELESRIAFQDEAIHSLSVTVATQQERIDALAAALDALREKLKDLEPSPLQGQEAEPPPPHY